MDSFVGKVWKVLFCLLNEFLIALQFATSITSLCHRQSIVLETPSVLTKQQRFKPSEEYETKK